MRSHPITETISVFLKFISWLVNNWLLAMIVAFFLLPFGPHMLWSYQYKMIGTTKYYIRCHYIGSRGFITPNLAPHCPAFALLDSRDWK